MTTKTTKMIKKTENATAMSKAKPKNKPCEPVQPDADDSDVILLEEFLPYRLTMLASQISAPLAAIYVKRFKVSIPEWRVVAVLGRFPGLSALDLRARTGLDKVAVSRAVTRLETTGRIKRTASSEDRRVSFLHLSKMGWHLYRQIVPFAKRIEQALLSDFSPAERATLFSFVDRLSQCLETIDHDGIP